MDKTLEMGRTSAVGSFQLFLGATVSTSVLAVGSIILARLMGPAEYGLYSISLLPAVMLSLFQDWGMSTAIRKYVAHFRAVGKDEDLHDIIVAGLAFETATGLALSFVSLVLAGFIGSTIFHRPESSHLISLASVTIFSRMLISASKDAFVGFERMGVHNLVTVCHAIAQSVASALLVFLGYQAFGATLGFTIASLVAAVIGFATFYFILFRKLNKTTEGIPKLTRTVRMMLRFGIPISISQILKGFTLQFYGFMMALFCTDAIIGNYKVASNFAVLLTLLTIPISTVLLPTFSKVDSQSEKERLKIIFTSSIKYTGSLLIPATMAVMVLAKPMVHTLYGDKWAYAPYLLTLCVVIYFFTVFGSLSLESFLAGLGETKVVMKMSLMSLGFGLPLAFLLIPTLGITGVILATILEGTPGIFWGLNWAWKNYGVKADLKSSAIIFIPSTVAAATTYAFLHFLDTAEWIELVVGGTLFLAVYIVFAPVSGAITKSDVHNLRTMFSGLGFASKLINILLGIIDKILIVRTQA